MNTEETEQVHPKLTPSGDPDGPGRGGSAAADGGGVPGAVDRAPETFSQRGPADFVHGEKELARVTGLAVKKIAAARKRLARGVDWDLTDLRVAFSRAGLAKVVALVTGRTDLPLEEAAAKSRIDGAPAAQSELARVVRLPVNRKLLQAELTPSGEALDGAAGPRFILVRVRSQKNFRRGMLIPVRRASGHGNQGTYELTRREPRYPGRW